MAKAKKAAKRSSKPAKRSVKPARKVVARRAASASKKKAKAPAKRKPIAKLAKKAIKRAVKKAPKAATRKALPKKSSAKKPAASKPGGAGSKIATRVVAVSAFRTPTRGKSGTQLANKKLSMPANTNGNKKEVSPGGGLVLPATKTAPAMRLRPDDAPILATAKERYGRKDLEIFRKLLGEQQQEAREEFDILSQNILDTSGEFEADNQAYSLHTAEQGTDAIEREKTFLHAQRTSDYIKKLDEALERIDRGIYGICVICGGLIEKERLQAVPITQKHVDCKNRTQARRPASEGGFRDVEEQPATAE